jgi:hypothetical protein
MESIQNSPDGIPSIAAACSRLHRSKSCSSCSSRISRGGGRSKCRCHREHDIQGCKSNSSSNISIFARLARSIERHTDSLELFVQHDLDSSMIADDISKMTSIMTSLRDIDRDGDESIDILQEEGCRENNNNNNNNDTDLDDSINRIGEESFNHQNHDQEDSDDLVEELQRFVAAEESIFCADDSSRDLTTIGSNRHDDLNQAVVNTKYIESDDETESTADVTESSSSSFSSRPEQEEDDKQDEDDNDNMINSKYHVRKLASTHRRPGIYPPSILPRSRQFDECVLFDRKRNTTDDSGCVSTSSSHDDDDGDSQASLALASKGTASTSSLDEDSSTDDDDDNLGTSHTLILGPGDAANTAAPIEVPTQRMHRHIRFSNVEIREFAVTVGDHPHARDSCPITLDWPYAAPYSLTLDEYENKRFFARKSCCSTSRKNLKRMSLEQRRQRVRETSRMAQLALREMELAVAMNRLQQSMDGINNFWRKIDETCNSITVATQEELPKRQQREHDTQQARQEQTQKMRRCGSCGDRRGKKTCSEVGTLHQVLASVTKQATTSKATSTMSTSACTGTKKSKKSSKQSSFQTSISSGESKQSKRRLKRMPRSTSCSSTSSSRGGSSDSTDNNYNNVSPDIEVIGWRRVNRAVI